MSLFAFFAYTFAFQLFTRKRCLQFSGLRMRKFMWNRFPIYNLLIDSLLTTLWRVQYILAVTDLAWPWPRAPRNSFLWRLNVN